MAGEGQISKVIKKISLPTIIIVDEECGKTFPAGDRQHLAGCKNGQVIVHISQPYYILLLQNAGGEKQKNLVKALEGYKSGTRSHPTMTALAKTLSQKDIEELAAYYAKMN